MSSARPTVHSRARRIRDRSKPSIVSRLGSLPLNPRNWRAVLNALLREFNHRHTLLDKDVSYKTQEERQNCLFRFFEELRGLGYKLDPRSLGNKHIKAAVRAWVERGLSAATIQTQLSFLSAFGDWIGKPGLVLNPEFYVDDPSLVKRTYVGTKDKSWSTNDVDVTALITEVMAYDIYAGVLLWVMAAFGLRVKEVLMVQPHIAIVPASATGIAHPIAEYYLWLKRGTKGKRQRYIPIDNDFKWAALAQAKKLAPTEEAHIGNPNYPTLKSAKERFYRVMKRFGITKKERGVTPHGLRHEYANDRYEEFTGAKAPLRGGEAIDPAVDTDARLKVAQELGHGRCAASGAYVGRVLSLKSKSETKEVALAEDIPAALPKPSMEDIS